MFGINRFLPAETQPCFLRLPSLKMQYGVGDVCLACSEREVLDCELTGGGGVAWRRQQVPVLGVSASHGGRPIGHVPAAASHPDNPHKTICRVCSLTYTHMHDPLPCSGQHLSNDDCPGDKRENEPVISLHS